MKLTYSPLAILVLLITTAITQAQTLILSDTFSQGTIATPSSLNGQTPTYSVTPETFTSNQSITTNGAEAVLPDLYTSSNQYAAVLGYVPIPSVALTGSDLTADATYTLSFNFDVTAGNGPGGPVTYVGFGTFDSTTNVPYQNGNEGIYAFDNGINTYLFDSAGGADDELGEYSGSGTNTVAFSLSITGGANDVDTVSASVNGTQILAPTAETLSPLSEVFVGDLTADGTVSDLSLTTTGAVPEPCTDAMIVGGAAFIGLLVRRRSACFQA